MVHLIRHNNTNYNTAMRRQNALPAKFPNKISCAFHISPSISILCYKILAEKLLQKFFGYQTLYSVVYTTNVCRVRRSVTKVATLNNLLANKS